MADRVEEFLFRGFIPEEDRGGTFHVVLNLGGKLVGPMTPAQAETRGWPLPAILADMDANNIKRAETAEIRAEAAEEALAETAGKLADAKKQIDDLSLVVNAQAEQVAAMSTAKVSKKAK